MPDPGPHSRLEAVLRPDPLIDLARMPAAPVGQEVDADAQYALQAHLRAFVTGLRSDSMVRSLYTARHTALRAPYRPEKPPGVSPC